MQIGYYTTFNTVVERIKSREMILMYILFDIFFKNVRYKNVFF